MSRQLTGEPYDRNREYAQNTVVEKDGVLYKLRHCKAQKYHLVPLCVMCAFFGRVRGSERGETRCARCGGTFREPEQRRGKAVKGYYEVRGGFQVQVRVKGVAKRRWLKSEDHARTLAAQWLREKHGEDGEDGEEGEAGEEGEEGEGGASVVA